MADEDVDIYSLAVACHNILRNLETQTPAHLQTNIKRLFQTLYHRLNAWGNYLGAFAVESASLDQRLRNASSVKELVTQNLWQLHKNLQFLIEKPPDTEAGRSRLDADRPPSDQDATQRLVYEAAERAIDRLERLGQTIRRSSTASLQHRVERFAEKNANTSMAELSVLVVQSRYPDAPESLITFLGRAVFLTYTRLKYKRIHQKKLQVHRSRPDLKVGPLEKVPEPVVTIDESAQPTTRPDVLNTIIRDHSHSTPGNPQPQPEPGLSSTAPSTLDNLPQRAPTSSAASSTMLSGVNYPKPPKEEFTKGLKICEWCFEVHHTSKFDDTRWWRRHVHRDLIPYVCISEDCAWTTQQFDSFEQWNNHMNDHSVRWAETVHAMVWICDIDHPEPKPFRSREAAEKHMLQEHNDTFSDAQISAMAKRNSIRRSRPLGVCPICSFDIQDKDRNTAHAFSEMDIGDEDFFLSVLERPLSNREPEEKRVRLDTSTPQTPSEPTVRTDFAGINKHKPFWHKTTEAELRKRTAKHVAEHLQSLAFFALRLLVLDERQMDSSSSDDDLASDQTLSDSTDTGVGTRSNLSDILDERYWTIPTNGSASFDFSLEDQDMCKMKPDDCSSVSTANATLGEDITNATSGEDVIIVGSTGSIYSYPFLSRCLYHANSFGRQATRPVRQSAKAIQEPSDHDYEDTIGLGDESQWVVSSDHDFENTVGLSDESQWFVLSDQQEQAISTFALEGTTPQDGLGINHSNPSRRYNLRPRTNKS